MKHYAIKGKPTRINWTFHSIAGEEFSLAGYSYRLYYSNGTSRGLATGVTHVDNVLTWDFVPGMQWKNGFYDIAVEIYSSGLKVVTVTYPQAFLLIQNVHDALTLVLDENEEFETTNSANQDDVATLNILSYCDFNRFVPLAPVIGSDGKWYINGQPVLDDNDNPVYADSTIDIEEDGTIVVNKDRHNEYTITSLKTALELAASDHSTAVTDHSTAASDHSTAVSDHSTAVSDHGRATDDHLAAVSDHATAESDHDIALDNNTLAAADHTVARADHATATSDHNTAAADHTTASGDHNTSVADQALALQDHNRAESDHITAAADHTAATNAATTAASDHSTAQSDHSTAASDHSTAASDHLTASSDHTTAAADHTTASNDHGTAVLDHATAVADHEAIDGALAEIPVTYVSAKAEQEFTSSEQALARANIDAQAALVSGTNIKTINNESILGSGNITVTADTSSCVKVTEQSFDSTQQAQARTNIGAQAIIDSSHKLDYSLISNTPSIPSNLSDLSDVASTSPSDGQVLVWDNASSTWKPGAAGDTNAVKYVEQTLTSEQQAQARTNIGAGTYSKPSGGIPSTDLASGVIPTVNNATLTVKMNNASKGTFTANASSNVEIDLGTVITSHQDISGKADKVSSATSGNFAGLDGNGNLTDSGSKASDFLTQHQDISGKEDTSNKVSSITGYETNTTKYPNTKAVYDAIAALPSPMVFQGTIGTSGTSTTVPSSPTEGDTYKIIEGGTSLSFPGISDTIKVGDTVVYKNSTTGWVLIPSGDEPSGTVTSVTIKGTSPIVLDSESAISTSGTRTVSHANSGVTAGTYKSVTVDAKGHVTAGSNPTTLGGYGITDAKIDNGVITLGSNSITPLTSHQDISGKEDTSNKVSSWSSTTTDDHYPSEKLVKDSLDAKQNTIDSTHKLDYALIDNTPTIPAAQVNSDWNSNSGVSQILNKPTIPTITLNGSSTTSASLYAPTSTGTSGQVLTWPSSGSVPTWSAVPTEIYWCTYGTTTFAELTAAWNDGKQILCFWSNRVYNLIYVGSSFTFGYVWGTTTYRLACSSSSVWSNTSDSNQSQITATGLLKGNGSGSVTAAVGGTDYQAVLVSGTNIKTINNESLLGSGNITIQGGGGTVTDVTVGGTSVVSEGVAVVPAIHNVPSGGTSGYVLAKASGTDYDLEWVAQSGGGSLTPMTDSEIDSAVNSAWV